MHDKIRGLISVKLGFDHYPGTFFLALFRVYERLIKMELAFENDCYT